MVSVELKIDDICWSKKTLVHKSNKCDHIWKLQINYHLKHDGGGNHIIMHLCSEIEQIQAITFREWKSGYQQRFSVLATLKQKWHIALFISILIFYISICCEGAKVIQMYDGRYLLTSLQCLNAWINVCILQSRHQCSLHILDITCNNTWLTMNVLWKDFGIVCTFMCCNAKWISTCKFLLPWHFAGHTAIMFRIFKMYHSGNSWDSHMFHCAHRAFEP